MASKTIKGLTIELDGNPTKLNKALAEVEKQSKSLSRELTDIQKTLRFDPSSVDALTQRKEVLAKAIKSCADKLDILREAEKQVQKQFKEGKVSEEQVRALQREIVETEAKMDDYQKSLNGTYTALNKLGDESDDVKKATQQMAESAEAAKSEQTKLAEALATVSTTAKGLDNELRQIDTLLKNNPDDIQLLEQKWRVLSEAQMNCESKLRVLSKTMDEARSSGTASAAQLRDLERQYIETQQKMQGYRDEVQEVKTAYQRLTTGTEEVEEATEQLDAEMVETEPHIDRIGDRVKELNTRYDSLTKQLSDVNRLLKDSPSSVALLAQKKELLAKAVKTAEERLEALTKAQQKAKRQFEIGEIDDDQFTEIKTEAAKAEAQLESLTTEMRQFGSVGERELDDVEEEAKDLRSALKNAGDGFTVMKGAVSDLLADGLRELVQCMKELAKYGLQTGMDFEAGMSRVVAISGATGDEIDRLTEKAKEMGAKTKFSAGESAEAFGYLAQAGWDTQQMIDGIDGVMNLAAADGIDLANASTIVADALTAMGYEAKDAAHFADVLAVASAESNTNVEMMGESFKYAAPLAGVLGYTMEDVAVALGLMANSGIKAETAGTSLRSLFTNLSKPSEQCAAAMEKYGISLTDVNGNAKPLNQLLSELRGTFSGLSESEQTALASTLAHKTGMSGLLAIINSSDEDFAKMTAAMNEADGAAEKMATTMQDNLAGDVEKLGGAFDTLAINLTEKFNGAMREGVQAITAFLDGEISMTEMLTRLSDAVSQAGDVIKGMLPELAQIGGELITYLVNGLVTGLPKLMSQATTLVTQFCSYIAQAAPNLVSIAGSLITSFVQGIFNFIPQLITGAAQIVGSLANGIQQNTSNFVSKALDLLNGFADKLASAIPVLIQKGAEFLLNMAKGISQALPEFIARAPEIISKFANLINDNFPTILAKGVGIIWELIKGLIKAIPTLIANIPKIIKAIVDVFTAFNWLNLGKQILTGIGNGIKAMWNWLKGIGTKTNSTLLDIIKSLPGKLLELGKNAVSKLGEAIRNGWPSVKAGATSFFNSIVNYFKGLPSKLLQVGKDLVKGLWNGISNMTSWVLEKIQGFGKSVLDGIKDFFGIKSPSRVFAEVGKFLDIGLAEGLLDNMDSPINAAKEMAEGVLDGAQDMDGFALENNLRQRSVQMAAEVTAKSDSNMLGKLDKILSAIERGQVLMIDGKQFVGGTVGAYDNALGQRRMLAARGAV